MTPYYDDGSCVIYHGDCREILPSLTFDVIVTDPPYGIGLDADFSSLKTRLVTARSSWGTQGKSHSDVHGDDEPFDPAPILGWPCAMFGANHFASLLPTGGTWHVWDKRDGLGSNMFADFEVMWTSFPSGPSRLFRHKWLGFMRPVGSPKFEFFHPTQKPVPLMRWLLLKCPDGTVLDPYVGSGTTLRAAKDLGKRAIGIEISEAYCEIAAKRLAQGVLAFDEIAPVAAVVEQPQ
jgi:DNA modification methylase